MAPIGGHDRAQNLVQVLGGVEGGAEGVEALGVAAGLLAHRGVVGIKEDVELRVEQVVLTAGGLILVFNQFWLNVIGIAVVAITLGMNTLRARR